MKTSTQFNFEIEINGKNYKFQQLAETIEHAKELMLSDLEQITEAFKKPVSDELSSNKS